jgi:haloacetate dehalogenase
MCEDYRAGASIDLVHDEADLATKIACPLLVLWGERGSVAGRYDALAIWRERAARVSGKLMPGGHSFQESHATATAAELRAFLAGATV